MNNEFINIEQIFSHKKSFDVTYILSILYLWIIFNYFMPIYHNRLHKIVTNNIYYMYISLYLFILLFFLTEEDRTLPLNILLFKTIFIFILIILLINSSFYISLIIVILLIFDQSIKYHIQYLHKNKKYDKNINNYIYTRKVLNILIIISVIISLLFKIFFK